MHDYFLKILLDESISNIRFVDEMKYITKAGESCLILHGDKFDGIVTKMKFLYWLGDNAYSLALFLNRIYNNIRINIFKKEYWSLSLYLKLKVKGAIQFINNYENLVVEEAKENYVNTVICGHIHMADDKMIGDVRYLNSGCCTEFCSAIVEHKNGKLELIEF